MFGGAGPAIGNHWGIGSLTDEMYDDAIVGMRASAQAALKGYFKRSRFQADMLPFGLAQDKKEGSTGRYNDTFRWKELSFKEKLQKETDEWLDKVLD